MLERGGITSAMTLKSNLLIYFINNVPILATALKEHRNSFDELDFRIS